MYYNEESHTVALSYNKKKKCATISILFDNVLIEDIYGNKVLIKQEEANLFQDALNLLRSKTKNNKKAV